MTCLIWLASIVAGIVVLAGAGWLCWLFSYHFGAGRYLQAIVDSQERFEKRYSNRYLETAGDIAGALDELEYLEEMLRRYRKASWFLIHIPMWEMTIRTKEIQAAHAMKIVRERLEEYNRTHPPLIRIKIPV